jgi:hypothetical protein
MFFCILKVSILCLPWTYLIESFEEEMKRFICLLSMVCFILSGCTPAEVQAQNDAEAKVNRMIDYYATHPAKLDEKLIEWSVSEGKIPSQKALASVHTSALCNTEGMAPWIGTELKRRNINCEKEKEKIARQILVKTSAEDLCEVWYTRPQVLADIFTVVDKEVKRRGLNCANLMQNRQMIQNSKEILREQRLMNLKKGRTICRENSRVYSNQPREVVCEDE